MGNANPGTKAETGTKKSARKPPKQTTLKIQNKREPKRTDFHILSFLRKQQSPLLALC